MSAPYAIYPLTREALRVDDNPLSLPVTHLTAPEPQHRCAPRILATCRACGGHFNLCDATEADVDALRVQAWLDPQCRGAKS